MATRVNRQTVDLSAYPDLIVMYLGMRVNHLYGIRTFFSFGRKISSIGRGKAGRAAAARARLLLHLPDEHGYAAVLA